MKFIDSVKQMEGPGGTLETWQLSTNLYLGFWKCKKYYDLFIYQDHGPAYTECIFNKLNHSCNEIEMTFGLFMPPRITIEHKYFDKFISLVEQMDVNDLTPDPFSG